MLRMGEIFRLLGMTDDQQRLLAGIDLGQLKSLEEYQRYFALASDRAVGQRQAFLQTLIGADTTTTDPEIIRWARRQLAMELINEADGTKIPSAQALVAKNLETDPQSIEDRKILAIIATVQKGNTNPAEPMGLFRDLLRDGWLPTPDEQFVLGQLFIAGGDWSEGSRYFTQLLNRTEGRNPEHIKRYIRLLISRRDGTEAELWLDVLRRDGVQDPDTAEMLAEIRYLRSQHEQLLRDLLAQETSYPETAWFQATLSLRRRFEMLTAYATRLQQDGRDALYERFAAASESMRTELESAADFPGSFYAAQLLARKEYRSAISALERVIASSTQDDLVMFTDTLLASPEVPTDQVERLEKVLASVDRPDDLPVLRVLVARLREMRGDYSGAEGIYRELLAANPKNTVVLNNLANLLALKRVKPEEALSLIEQAIALLGETPMLLDTRAMCHLAAGQLPLARKDMETAVAAYPHPLLRFHLAQTMFEAREFALAKQEFDRALRAGLQRTMLPVLEQPLYDRMTRQFQPDAPDSPGTPSPSTPSSGGRDS
jgi:Tfp pilus assembly protein PilF